ncbi:MAG: HEAT repeat domain-containing protein [Nitrospiraceae bacterium]|nr:HEAT repeat domain-containing protein [Nitrospiraceae bacterium]
MRYSKIVDNPYDRDTGLRPMIADYMENGFLENIIDMFRYDSSLYGLVGELIQDERVRVRIGVTAMMEELRTLDSRNLSASVPVLLPLLDHHKPVVRGDVTNILGLIGDRSLLPVLEKMLGDEDSNVRIIAGEAIGEIMERR